MTRFHNKAVLLLLAAALPACSYLDLGPQPSNDVGESRHGPQSLTDPDLQAVTPEAPAEIRGDELAPTTMAGAGAIPETMPAATQPTTTRPANATNPATHPALGQGTTARPSAAQDSALRTHDAPKPALGKIEVPSALTVQEAILVGLQNNSSLKIQRYNVPLARTSEQIARAAFDPTISGSISGGRSAAPNGTGGTSYTDTINAQVAATEFLPTGTTVSAGYTTNNSFYSDASSSSGISASVTQSLLRGAGLDVNLASLRQAQLATKISQYELRGFAENLVANIELTYWDLAFAERQVIIVQNALDVAQQQLDQTNDLIKFERAAQSERPQAEAEVALRKEALINAKSTLETTRIRFLQLITPPGKPFWNRPIALHTLPSIPTGTMDAVDKHVEVALKFRPEINETRLRLQSNDLEIVQTKNGLLPQLDLFLTLGQTGFSNSFFSSIPPAFNGPNYDVVVGVQGSYPIGNRAPRAAYRASLLTKEQTESVLDNLVQTVQVDVRTQYIEVERTRQQIDATRATRIAQETAYQVEREKFAVGKSTSLLVAQAQRDLLAAQLSEVQAVTGHLKSLVTLYRLEGTLLYRRGLEAPGAAPPPNEAWKQKHN